MNFTNEASRINKIWLDATRKIIADNAFQLTGDDLYLIYMALFNQLKDYRGVSTGYVGHSELLVHFLLSALYGNFKVKPKPGSINKQFVDKTKGLVIESSPLLVLENGLNYQPDHVIYFSQELLGIIAVKLYQVSYQYIQSEVTKIKELGKPALMIFYSPPTQKPRNEKNNTLLLLSDLKKEMSENASWFDYLILKNNPEILAPILLNFLQIIQRRAVYWIQKESPFENGIIKADKAITTFNVIFNIW